ncbi:MAG: hypothetical protein A2V70_18895 [Planctomycetes bacterium RBG_13_63_9]|nr:MAG: hypothetical protein A2V70_18895 [Planctomycetes bacterium RBG_13_63_9]
MLRIEAEGLPVLCGDLGIADGTILGISLDAHQEGATHPVGQKDAERRQRAGQEDRPAQEESERIIDRFRQHVQVLPVLGPQRTDIVGDAHAEQNQAECGKPLAHEQS